MNVTYRTDKNIIYIAVEGRIDASNVSDVEKSFFEIKAENKDKHTVIDADKLKYISSAGLRLLLKLRKDEPKLAIINVAPEVYDVLDMTGFTDMLTVEKAYRRMSVEGCEFIAKGANGAVYRYDAETILKTYHSKDALPEIRQERENARRAFVLGVNTAIPYGIVRVGEGYGTVTELLDAVNVTRLIINNPENLEKPAEYYVELLKSIHAVEADEGDFPDMRETALSWVDFISKHIPAEQGAKLCDMIRQIPKTNNLLHGDYHTNNVMIQNGEPLLIDLDTLCVGHPIFEFGSMYNAFLGFSELNHDEIKKFMGYDRETSGRFWNLALRKYLGTEDATAIAQLENKARIIGYTRLLRRTIRRPDEQGAKERKEHYTKQLTALIDKVDTLLF
ncbi:MAG: anti-sigma factor antagonist [Clostridia bacterium]|nr:anti-sigma factor antagonist [Clostridia bacterium]